MHTRTYIQTHTEFWVGLRKAGIMDFPLDFTNCLIKRPDESFNATLSLTHTQLNNNDLNRDEQN